jgi:anhydro-N-acetylmuramic acid kinase
MPDLYVGLMSGTSMDGIDAVVASFNDSGVNILATHSHPYPDELKNTLLAAIREPLTVELDASGELHRQVGICFRDAALAVIDISDVESQDIRAIGSHGQTLRHQPNADKPFSLQIGDGDVIANGTGITTVANFRQADIAAGGQGAPLVPPFHEWLFHSTSTDRMVVNIGGISNITVLRSDGSDTIGFDTGPGNGLMDAWTKRHLGTSFDDGGKWASSGAVVGDLLRCMLEDPYFELEPPKSTGFEYFNLDWLSRFDVDQYDAADVQTTLCELSASSIAASLSSCVRNAGEVFVCGGGVRNSELMSRLRQNLPTSTVTSTTAVGLDPDWVEAVAFAWLAMRTLNGETGNLPSVTGASHKVVLGDLHSS